jgi:hypothetical protein
MVRDKRDRWIFVSHASADLRVVRQVRNYLEEKGASPLLFHLRALTHQEEFWPIIEKEIAARNFFLYCDSEAAGKSEWVQRERRVIEALDPKPRVGDIRVDQPGLDLVKLDRFLMSTKVFATFNRQDNDTVSPFLDLLEDSGYILTLNRTPAARWAEDMDIVNRIGATTRDGFVVVFLSSNAVESKWVELELRLAHDLGARFVPVLLERVASFPSSYQSTVLAYQWFDATVDPSTALVRFLEMLNNRTW